ncbi:GntR family transcriptional regulator [Ktedonobacter racemifer]|uniref:GntR family transcriptional regulator n=1 Tax=Ktedonobacter racemifer TaxID=363277 RepID=UPI00058F8497
MVSFAGDFLFNHAKRRQALQNTADLALNRTFTMPLHRQLYDRLRHAILSGQLHPGQVLPSTRALASELGISLKIQ